MATKKLKKIWSSTKGVLSLEASIVLSVFIFLMLFMYSFLVVFEARNHMAHVLLTTADSLALDGFANETPNEASLQEILHQIYGRFSESNGQYTDTSKWYNIETESQEGQQSVPAGGQRSDQLLQTIKARFTAYLADGDVDDADRILKGLNIVDGLNGLDFSGSYISGDDIYVVVRYALEYEFNLFGLGRINLEQRTCSKIWK